MFCTPPGETTTALVRFLNFDLSIFRFLGGVPIARYNGNWTFY